MHLKKIGQPAANSVNEIEINDDRTNEDGFEASGSTTLARLTNMSSIDFSGRGAPSSFEI